MLKALPVLTLWAILLLTAIACATAAPAATPLPTATPALTATPTPAPTVAPVPTATARPTPTATPRPTRPPTITSGATRMPTSTPPPTATPSPTATPAPPTPAYYPHTPRPPATISPTPTLAETSTCFLFADGAHLFREHDAIRWSECPAIENGILRAAGTVLGGRTLLNSPSVATFVIKYRNTDREALIILRPAPPGASYPNTPGTAEAILWDVSSRSFSIKVPVGNLAEPVDLLVWGSDIPGANIKSPALAIHSIRYIR